MCSSLSRLLSFRGELLPADGSALGASAAKHAANLVASAETMIALLRAVEANHWELPELARGDSSALPPRVEDPLLARFVSLLREHEVGARMQSVHSELRHILLDGAQSGPMKNLAVLSDVAPSYAPPGKTLCVAAIPGPSALDPQLEVEVRKQLAAWHRDSHSWETIRVDVIPHGQPLQLPPLDPRRSVRLGAGRYVCGDHRDTASIQGALFSGRRAAAAVLADLQSPPAS
jgi:hypothetical protein